jgi:hypothetical protein
VDKCAVFDADDVLRVDSQYPVELEIPVEVIAERATPEGAIAVIQLPWGLSEGQVEPIEVHTSKLIDRAQVQLGARSGRSGVVAIPLMPPVPNDAGDHQDQR